jgi:hypothetical protein
MPHHRDRALMVERGSQAQIVDLGRPRRFGRGGAARASAASMSYLPRFQVLPLLTALAFGGAACTDDDGPPKLVSVANQTSAAHTVTFGDTAFGSVAANTMTDYLEVDAGALSVMVDGTRRLTTELGSDNVGGSWTLYLQSAGDQLLVGVSIDE